MIQIINNDHADSIIWSDGKEFGLYSTDIALVRDMLRRKSIRLWGEYFDRKGRLFALQVKLSKRAYKRIARYFRIPQAEPPL